MSQRELSQLERDWFRQQSSRAQQAHRLGGQQNAYERELAGVQQGWRRQDTTRQYDRARETLHNPWNRRGMMNSGGWQNQLSRWSADRTRDIGRTNTMAQMQNQGFGLAQDQLDDVFQQTKEDLRLQRDAYERTLAAVYRQHR